MKSIPQLILALFLLISCRENVDLSQLENYEGPIRITTNMELYHSDSAKVRTILTGDKQLEFPNGDIEFPEGISIDFFEKNGELSTTIRADRGFYDRKNNLYMGEGDVEVHNIIKDQKLNSEELFWDPNKDIIFTEKFVTVQRQDGTIINGTGMEADQQFNEYTFHKIERSKIPLPGEE
ncbi:LPS export ABC transporter periplasmic protein LptC [Echinicola jeungdonensis]|uniref:LPS export ABC transporter periplasmic protein LptC n=1 Tax=Echinicola jeungdonensis TaxID=709343 RepID=A0ABV5J1X9_9BACT|nr:LPS export ABC transporter periplasmic protein LptC [Echinicola jeungdonensis]MDN3668982.1 LPS export ABC transporter periplasmic protein LptC [Echinicola jeungdonensis]